MVSLRAGDLTLDEVHKLLRLEERDGISFESLLNLEPITESDRHDLDLIRVNSRRAADLRFVARTELDGLPSSGTAFASFEGSG
jgi:hypothetical protein